MFYWHTGIYEITLRFYGIISRSPAFMKKILVTLLLLSEYVNVLSQTDSFNNVMGHVAFNNYSFIAPENWQIREEKDFITLTQSQTGELGCVIIVFSPQPSSGDLETDAQNVFTQMYSGWQFRSTGEKQYDLSKGQTLQGLEYSMVEAPMSKMSADGSRYDGFEDGAALVIRTGNKIVIIAVRHTTMLAHNDCLNKYETWRRFFNSFTVKNAAVPKNTDDESSKRIVGVWKLTGSGPALGEYIFAANGNYQLAGAIGTSYTTTDYKYEYLYIKTYAFQGDGSYSMEGNQLTFRKRENKNPERAQFRFEKVNHGDTGWRDRLYMLKTDSALGTKYEVCYEKKDR
ncbi:MAG: hypothetical protein C0490_02230 [Marivirga sp.]|nr:hypothetical protein [Marivirga sp.]